MSITMTHEDWVSTAEPWQLEAEKSASLRRIENLWSDPDLSLARDRYEQHDREIMLIRRIDERLATADTSFGAR